jgi:hypothetical protein
MKGHSIRGTTMTAEKKGEPQTVNPPSLPTRTGTLASLRGIAKRDGPPPTDEVLNDEYTDYLIQKYR